MKIPKINILWTAVKNCALPDTLSRNTPAELLTQKNWRSSTKYKVLSSKRRKITTIRINN